MVAPMVQAGSDGPANSRYLAGPPSSKTSPNHGPATARGNKVTDALNSADHQAPPPLGSRESSMDGQDRSMQDAGNFKSSIGGGKIKGGKVVSSRKSLTPIGVDGEDLIDMNQQEEVVRAASTGQMDQRLSWLENRTRMAMGMSVVDAIKRFDIKQKSPPNLASPHRPPALRVFRAHIFPPPPCFTASSFTILVSNPHHIEVDGRTPAAVFFMSCHVMSCLAFPNLHLEVLTPIRLVQALHECGRGCHVRQLSRL